MPKKKKTTVEVPGYSVQLKMNGIEYASSGATVLEAIKNLGIDYTRVKTKGELTVQIGEQRHTRVVQLPRLRRYFASKLLMSGLIRDLETLLK